MKKRDLEIGQKVLACREQGLTARQASETLGLSLSRTYVLWGQASATPRLSAAQIKLTAQLTEIKQALDRGQRIGALAQQLQVDRSTLSRFCQKQGLTPAKVKEVPVKVKVKVKAAPVVKEVTARKPSKLREIAISPSKSFSGVIRDVVRIGKIEFLRSKGYSPEAAEERIAELGILES